MFEQLSYFWKDYQRATGKYWFRGLYMWCSWTIIGIFIYRIERGMYCMFGKTWTVLRVVLYPLLMLIQALSKIDIKNRQLQYYIPTLEFV